MAGFLIKVSVEQDFQDLEGLLELGTGSGGGDNCPESAQE